MEHPFNNFPVFPLSGVVERQNIQARNHFLCARTNDQDSHQPLGPGTSSPTTSPYSGGIFVCCPRRLDSNDIFVGKPRTLPDAG